MSFIQLVKSTLATFDAKSFKKKQHTVYCVLHGMESSVGIYYETLQVP